MLAIATTSLLPSRRRRANKRCKLAKASLREKDRMRGSAGWRMSCALAIVGTSLIEIST